MTPENFDIRYSDVSDLSYLTKWLSEEGATDDFPFGPEEKEDPLKNWIGFSKFRASLTGMIQETPCAIGTLFLMPYKKVAHHASFYLFVDPQHRKKGIGTSMIKNLIHLAKTRFRLEALHVEIYEPSLLLSILLKLGFAEFARQEKYVKMSNEVYRARILLEHFFDGA